MKLIVIEGEEELKANNMVHSNTCCKQVSWYRERIDLAGVLRNHSQRLHLKQDK